MDNANSPDYLEKIKIQIIENLKNTAHAPSVQMTDVPRTTIFGGTEEDDDILDDLDEDENPETRTTQRQHDQRIVRDDEFDESDDEEMAAANGVRPQNGASKARNIMNHGTNDADVDMESGVASPLQSVDIIAAIATEANAEINAEVMEAKTRDLAAALEAGETGPSNAPTRSHSRAPLDNEGDVEMGEPVTELQASILPNLVPIAPLSPAASIPTSIPANAESLPAPTEELNLEEETVQ